MAAAARTLEGRWRLRPLVSASHCVWEDRREPWEQGGQVVLGGCGHRLCWLMGDVRALEGIGFPPPPAALSRSAVFQRDPITISLQSQGRGRSRGDRRELPAGQRGPFKPPHSRTPVHDHLRFGDWFGKPSELLNAVPQVSVEPQALKVLSEELMCLIFSRGWPGRGAQWPLPTVPPQCTEGEARCVR